MNKKIKIIDLLNKVANGEEVPKTIRAYYGNVHDDYKYDEILKWYITLDDTTVLNAIDKLNMKVEILEDNTEEIEELEKEQEAIANPKTMMQEIRFYYDSNKMGDKINEIIRYIKRKDKSNDK